MITVCIPTIPPRADLLQRAIVSVLTQTHQAEGIHVEVDVHRRGAGATRNQAMLSVQTPWTAFLDDDDTMRPNHLQRLFETAMETDADLVFPWFDVKGGRDPFPQFEGLPWDSERPRMFPVTILAKTEMLISVGGFGPPNPTAGDDWPFWQQINASGAKIVHLNERTWIWHHDSGNTSGLPDRW